MRYFRIRALAAECGIPEKRLRQWRRDLLLRPSTFSGSVELYTLEDVERAAAAVRSEREKRQKIDIGPLAAGPVAPSMRAAINKIFRS